MDISDESPRRYLPNFIILVYPPGLSLYLGPNISNNFTIAALSLTTPNANRLLCKSPEEIVK